MIVLDALERGDILFSISIDSSPALDIYDLQSMVADKLNRPLTIKEMHKISRRALDEGLVIDKMFLEPVKQLPYTYRVLFPSPLLDLHETGLDIRLTAAPRETFRTKENGETTLQESQYINMNHPSVKQITHDDTFIEMWKIKFKDATVRDNHLMVDENSALGQAINNEHCANMAKAMYITNRTSIIHIGSLPNSCNGDLLARTTEMGFKTIGKPLLDGNVQDLTSNPLQEPVILHSELSLNPGDPDREKYAAEMEYYKTILSVLGQEDLFFNDAENEMEKASARKNK